jgi:hypothetical protein
MPVVCINRPNRSKPRQFTERDLERIAKTMVKQGHPVRNIVATILIATGLGALTCALSGAIKRTLGILAILKQIAAVLATAGAVNAVIIWLQRIARVARVPVVTQVVALLLVLALAIRALAAGAAGLASDLETIENAADTIDGWCEAVREKLPDFGG